MWYISLAEYWLNPSGLQAALCWCLTLYHYLMTPYYKLHVHKQVDRPDLHYNNKQDHDKDKELNEKGK